MDIKNRIRGQQNVKKGIRAEQAAERHLVSLGVKCIEPIETGWHIIRKNGKIVGAKEKKKVAGDFTAIGPGGTYIHVEVKARASDRLIFSDLERHQVKAMEEKTKAGAICLLVWVKNPYEIIALQWPINGFIKGRSIKWKDIT